MTLESIILIELSCEMLLSVPSILFNLYTVLQISRIATVNSNLKIVLAVTSFSTAMASFFHTIIHGVNRDTYSVQKGNVKMAFLIYFLHYMCHSLTLIGNLKFIAIAVERKLAFKRRTSYEHGEYSIGHCVAGATVFCAFTYVLAKIIVFLNLPWKDKSLDSVLQSSFLFEGTLYYYIVAYLIAGVSWLYGLFCFRSLKKQVNKCRYIGTTLSERYEIKQTLDVIRLMRAILKAFAAFYTVALFGLGCLIYAYYEYECTETTKCYSALANVAYICLSCYNLFYGIYVIWYFPSMRALMFNDLCLMFGIKINSARFDRKVIEDVQSQAQHFRMLQQSWNPVEPERNPLSCIKSLVKE